MSQSRHARHGVGYSYLALSRCSKAVVSLGVMRFLVSRGGLGFGTTALKRNFFDDSCVDSVLIWGCHSP